jgi:hypothetical protein
MGRLVATVQLGDVRGGLCDHTLRQYIEAHHLDQPTGCGTGLVGIHMHKEDEPSGGMIRCEACDTAIPAYDIVSYGSIEHGYRQLCSQCFNAEVASAQGLERFENPSRKLGNGQSTFRSSVLARC